jgi:hypothetical protein
MIFFKFLARSEKSVKSQILLFLSVTFLSPGHQKRLKNAQSSFLDSLDLGPRITCWRNREHKFTFTLIPAVLKSICNNVIRFIKLPEVTTYIFVMKIYMQSIKDSIRSIFDISNRNLIVADWGVGECMDPEGNGVTMAKGARGGLAHQVGNKISSWSATAEETRLPWGNQEDSKAGPMRHQELITHRLHNIVKWWLSFCLYIVNNDCVSVTRCLTMIVCFRRINHTYGSKKLFAIILWCTHGSRRSHLCLTFKQSIWFTDVIFASSSTVGWGGGWGK